jgi:hypothetical protein
MSEQELLNVGLPKWPQMYVWGKSVTVDQAKDIILRTDSFLTDIYEHSGGNNHRWNEWARTTLGYQQILDAHKGTDAGWRIPYEVSNKVREEIGYISTEYVHNTWASSSFIYGPYGWCHPDGMIWYQDNVGKWPSTEDIHQEWVDLAAAFQYLDLTATLMSGEGCEDDTKPLVSFRVKDGKCAVIQPIMPEAYAMRPRDIGSAVAMIASGFNGREQGLPDEWVVEYGERIRPMVERIHGEIKAQAA